MAGIALSLPPLIFKCLSGKWAVNQLRDLCIGALKQGPIPQHIAFVMDGNRRYARSHGIETSSGHYRGYEAFDKMMEICFGFGIKVITVYLFSVENFNRPKSEVEQLMQLIKAKVEMLDRYGASIRLLGQREMIPDDVLQVMDNVVARTKHNKKAALNICLSYTSRAEITTAIQSTVEEVLASPSPQITGSSSMLLDSKNVTANMLERHIYTAQDPPLDMLIRTSGVSRLSDFMLWQCHQDTRVFFLKCLWPDFGAQDVLSVLLEWQRLEMQNRR